MSTPVEFLDSCHHRPMPLRVLAPLLLIFGLTIQSALAAFVCPHLDDDAGRAMDGWQVPGLALGVVQADKVIAVRTYGEREAGTGQPVTASTLFAVGSITKSLTSLGFSVVSLRGDISLDSPVRWQLPSFPDGITFRHLLSHTSGWPRHDALWYLDDYGMTGIARRLALLPRFAPPGAAFQYNNVTYAAAGRALENISGASWHDWIYDVILEPAGMKSSVTTVSAFRTAENRARGYFPADTGRIPVVLRNTDPVAPAAGLCAHLDDMLRYVQLLTNGGVVGDRRVVQAAAVRALFAAAADAPNRRYGLGLNLSDWRGRAFAYHPGVVDGFGARISLLPGLAAGVIVLSNMSGQTPTAQIVSQTVLDCLVGHPRVDWVAAFGNVRPPPKPKPPPPPAAELDTPLAQFAGTYLHPAYGAMTFVPNVDGTGLTGRFHTRIFSLGYVGNATWRVQETALPLREGLLISFSHPQADGFASLATPLADGPVYRHNAGPLEFRRGPLPSPRQTPL
jgi:CubicO group peptidase (beta-lactamase class C family)